MDLLIVDDHLINLKLLRAQLESEGHVVFEAHDGVDAFALLERQHVDVVISDILMPRMDGYSLCYEIRKHTRLCDLPIIIYTSTYLSPGDENLALDMGADKYLKKPVSVATIVAALHEIVAQPHAAPRPDELREVETLKNYNERLVSKLKEKNTELQAQTEGLRESELQYRTLADSGQALIWTSGPDKKCDYFNQPWLMFTGRTLEQELGDGWAEGVHPDDLARCFEIYTTAFDRRECFSMDYRLRRHDGEFRWIQDDGSPRYDSQGNFLGYIGHCLDITELKRAEDELQRFFRLMPDLVCIASTNGHFLKINPAWQATIGYTEQEILSTPFLDFIHSDDRDATMKEVARQVAGGATTQFINRYRCKDGSYKWFEWRATPAVDKTLLFAAARDITERKRAEETIARERQLLRTLVDVLPETFYVKDLDSRFLVVNETAAKQYGKDTPAQLLGLSDVDLYPAGLAAEFRAEEMKVFAGEPLISHEDSMVFLDGRKHTVLTTKLPFRDSQGRICGLVGIGQDITGRKRAEKEIQILAHAVETTNELICITDMNDRFTFVNKAFLQGYGYTAEEVLGQTPVLLASPNNPPELSRNIMSSARTQGWRGELINRRKDGSEFPISLNVSPIHDATGQTVGLMGMAQDITEKKLLEEKFLHAQRLESIGLLSAGIAHDLNNVLAPIVLAAPLLRDSLSTARDLKILDMLEKSAERGAGLVKQILGFAHTSTGEFRPMQVKHLARDLISVIEQTFPKSIQLEQQISSDLWPVQGNATQIHQVLLNLCVNARDAMPSGVHAQIEEHLVDLRRVALH